MPSDNEERFQAGYNVLNSVVDWDINNGVAAALEPEHFYIEMLYDKRFVNNKLGKNVTVNYDLA